MSKTSSFIRWKFGEGDTKRDEGLETPKDVERFDDITYGPDPTWNVLDVYRPAGSGNEKLPVIVSVHGGGWVYGDKVRYRFYCMELCRRGFAVVNYTYRLAPEFVFPAALEDTNMVFTWLLDHADQYGFDIANIFATGDSAGGNYLGLYAAIVTNPKYAAKFSFKVPDNLRLKAINLNCGVYHLTDPKYVDSLTKPLMSDVFGHKPSKKDLIFISPTYHVSEDYPTVFLNTAVGDFLRIQAPFMAKSLARKGVPFVYKCYGDKLHDLHHVFMLTITKPESGPAIDEICDFFRTHISE